MVNVTGSVNIRRIKQHEVCVLLITKLMVKKLCGVDMTRRVSVMLIAHLVVRIHHVL